MFDLISIGDAVIDTVVPLEEADILVGEDGVRRIAVDFGAKIPVGMSRSMVGGNAANNAVGSARLKLKTAIYTNVGNFEDDRDDDRIKAKFKKEGVDTRYVVETDELPSNHNIILEYKGERTILVHHQSWEFDLPDLDNTKWVYLTSMSPSYTESNVVGQILNYLERTHAKLAYQPGTFQIKTGLKKSAKILSFCDFFIVNKEEAKHLLGLENGEKADAKKLLKNLADYGPKRVVVTDGKAGSYSFDGVKFYKLECFPAKLVEMTGAGDSYATGVVAGLIFGKDLHEAMRWGAANAASVVEQIGPQAGLLTFEQMQAKLKEHSNITAKEI